MTTGDFTPLPTGNGPAASGATAVEGDSTDSISDSMSDPIVVAGHHRPVTPAGVIVDGMRSARDLDWRDRVCAAGIEVRGRARGGWVPRRGAGRR
jgi:hypothetical protein